HHDQAGHNKIDVVIPTHLTYAPANQVAKNQEVQTDGDRRRNQRLQPDAGKAPDLFYQNGFKRNVFMVRKHRMSCRKLLSFSNLKETIPQDDWFCCAYP